MLATGNLPGLTAPGEGASAVGYFMASVVSFLQKKKSAREAGAELPVGSCALLRKELLLEVPL